jgi:hypothetical protein
MKLRLELAVMCMLAGAGVNASDSGRMKPSFWQRYRIKCAELVISKDRIDKLVGVSAIAGKLGAIYLAYRVGSWAFRSKKHQHKNTNE